MENNSQVVEEKEKVKLLSRDLYRILFLEDNPDDVELMVHELNEARVNFTSLQIDRKKEFISSVSKFKPDVILADYSLSMFNGMQAYQLLKKERITVPF